MQIEAVTFFRPDEVSRKTATLPAQTYNHIRLLFNRSMMDCQFVPIRSLQYMGVITQHEVIFADAQNYAVRDGEGGRMIMLAWEFNEQGSRDSLNEPLTFKVVHYYKDMGDIELRLYREFSQAMELLLTRQLIADKPDQRVKVVSIAG